MPFPHGTNPTPDASIYVRIAHDTRPDGTAYKRYQFGRGRWETAPVNRSQCKRQADKIAEELMRAKTHLLNLHEAYRDDAPDYATMILAFGAILDYAIEEWDSARHKL